MSHEHGRPAVHREGQLSRAKTQHLVIPVRRASPFVAVIAAVVALTACGHKPGESTPLSMRRYTPAQVMDAFAAVDYPLHPIAHRIVPRFDGILERDVIVWLVEPSRIFQESDGVLYRVIVLATPAEAAHAARLERGVQKRDYLVRNVGNLLVEWFRGTGDKPPPDVRAGLAKLRQSTG